MTTDTTATTGTPGSAAGTLRVIACVCTYKRNEPLARLLTRLAEIGEASPSRFQLGVVVVDDNPGAIAAPVVASFADRFPLGVHHRVSGKQNISLGRNIALEAASELGDVLVMTDDDCLPEARWIDRLLDTKESTGADSVSGPMVAQVADGCAPWILEQHVFDFDHPAIADGTVLEIGQTNNCLIDIAWLRRHPDHRFDPEFGRIGGEDMMFFHGAVARGMKSVHSAAATVLAFEPLDDLTYRAMLRSRYWWGNSEAVTNIASGSASRPRVFVRGAKRLLLALAMPGKRVLRRSSPHLRVASINVARSIGLMTGALGLRANHH